LLATVVTAGLLAAPAAAEEPERKVTLSPPGPATWDGQIASGSNTDYDSASGEPCGDGFDDQCDTTLLHVNVPDGFWDQREGAVEVSLDNYLPNPASDFDLYIYESNASGARGEFVTSSAGLPGALETAEIEQADGHYLVQVVYFAVTASRYSATADFISREAVPPPSDVDEPRGLQDVLASDPTLGFRSHSEPHIAQSPTDPNMLVAASKMYNRDPDSLEEYEFKIGSYVSFDGGRSWSDLGQTAVCPPSEAPPESWPGNTCYPKDDPEEEGTGVEDGGGSGTVDLVPNKVRDTLENDTGELGELGEGDAGEIEVPSTTMRGGDYGEEYITSDPWVQFDDEGNAYLMVLDSPPFSSHPNGWGMSFHRWKSPSPGDIEDGDTWSRKIVINNYPNELLQPQFLDDKNTFAVNNAGADGNGQIGTIVACWGQNIDVLIKQQTVCEASTNGGRSWPGPPIPVSPPTQQLVIGVSVVADNQDPNRFYAIWLHYTPSIVGLESEYWASQTLDGGRTWTPPVLAAQVEEIPLQFPGQEFRNLSIPIMAAGPNEGQLYTTYAEYRPAFSADDEDGMQADIMLIKSTDGGITWTDPSKVNTDGGDADQFQPAIAVTGSGQVNVSYFDRRHDPSNFYIDTYLSRSNDGGQTFVDTRVSHDVWDPSINPPISPSGDFIGDYQGLVADNCFAIPFVNDTHLANEPSRDPAFDDEEPASEFQEVFSWRVPNTPAFGGAEPSSC
jgi:hypothetical protein